ncbi:MAG: hypothetical protein OJI67_23370 [Prosthecobacter sp.]|nr:hypothetical protein [Prosthecobacter sp.]
MKMTLKELVAVCFLILAVAGCNKNSDSESVNAKTLPSLPTNVPLQRSILVEAPQPSEMSGEYSNFPATPLEVPELSTDDFGFAAMSDSELGSRFESVSGVEWNQALLEMKRRQTPSLVLVMTKSLDEIKGIVVVSGEAIYAPELRYPVARALIECGEKSVADLVKVCTSPNFGIRKRVLAARVLRQLQAKGHQSASIESIYATIGSSAELAVFNELWAIAEDNTEVFSVLGDQ